MSKTWNFDAGLASGVLLAGGAGLGYNWVGLVACLYGLLIIFTGRGK